MLLRAWRLVVQLSGPDVPELILVGDGPDRPRLESMINQFGLADAVTITGAIPRTQVITALQQADVFALPVRTRLCGLNPEGLGVAALEAASTGLPVIIGNSGGAPETVRHRTTGFVVDPNDHVDLAGRISALLSDADLRRAMGAAGRSMVQECFGAEQARATLRLALRL
jgi:phosphatidyl-myo-inositol dimannoside synthase